MRRVDVELGDRSYPVLVGAGSAAQVAAYVTGPAVIVQDRAVPSLFELPGAVTVPVEGGEEAKTMAGLERLLAAFAAAGLGRDGTVVAVGGGSITDVAGFAAAAWQRGVTLVNVPTTLLGMVDAAIGGKTGINFKTGKNQVGAFWQPAAVVCDIRYLETLPAAEWGSAMAEVVKYDLTLDPGVSSATDREELVARCVAAKAAVVAADEREGGLREVLNYGHTAGHAIEAESGFTIPHGVAVAIGMRVAARLATEIGLCGSDLPALHDSLLAAHGLPGAPPPLDVEAVFDRLRADKKSRGGRPRWVLLEAQGRPRAGVEVADGLVREALAGILGA